MRRLWIIALLLVVLAMTACHTTRRVAAPPKPEKAPEVVAREYTLINFTGVVDGISVSGQMRVARDSAMWISVNKFVEVGRAMATRDSLWLVAPLLGRNDMMDYADMRRLTRTDLTYGEVEAMVLGDNPEASIAELARRMGIEMRVRITRRERVPHLTFPFTKPTKP